MPRQARIVLANTPHHIVERGHNRETVFIEPQDSLYYLDTLKESLKINLSPFSVQVDNREVRLMPGMAVTAEVKTGTRRIIEFFLAPLLRYKQESIRER